MLRINNQRREVEALEKMARASVRIANAANHMAECEREKTGFFRWFVGLFGVSRNAGSAPCRRRYGGDGGLRSGVDVPPVLPTRPSGGNALLAGERPCINVTHSVQQHARR